MRPGRCARAQETAGSAQGWKRGRRWRDYTLSQRGALCALALVEVVLAAAAWTDLARRDPALVRGRKRAWAPVIAVNIVGPLAYFRWGRLPAARAARR